MTNLGKLLAEAGVKGGKPDHAPLTLAEARAMSKKSPAEEFANEAMKNLSQDKNFKPLFDANKGETFMYELRQLLDDVVNGDRKVTITEHTVYAIVQLAHRHRDRLQGSKRTSFKRIIPTLLQVKSAVEKKVPADLAKFVLEKITPPKPPSLELFPALRNVL